jgi:hypothetical protein
MFTCGMVPKGDENTKKTTIIRYSLFEYMTITLDHYNLFDMLLCSQ